jgi:hypothetical protein
MKDKIMRSNTYAAAICAAAYVTQNELYLKGSSLECFNSRAVAAT